MSWRRFSVLLRGLSPNSYWYMVNSKTDEVIEDTIEAEKAVNRIW